MIFANVRNDEIIDFNSKFLDEDIKRIETTSEIYKAYLEDNNKVKFLDNKIILNPEYEAQQAQKERERLDSLSLTAADVERAIYKVKGMDFEDILNLVKDNPEIDLKALKIELKANNFYRGNPYINQIGAILGFSGKQLDEFFETKDYTKLLPNEEQLNSTGEASDASSNTPVNLDN